ncbi:MAG TPA: P1 family peptidase [Candidatus Solibacter sp.]|nr:P1 family peptidase [Candidatus Solibacter sp.]
MKQAMKGGVGTSSIKVGDTGVVVGAIVAVNAPATWLILIQARLSLAPARKMARVANEMSQLRHGHGVRPSEWNTTIAVVATNATFTKTEMSKVAQMASAGMASSPFLKYGC